MSLKIAFLFVSAFYILRRISAETDLKDFFQSQGLIGNSIGLYSSSVAVDTPTTPTTYSERKKYALCIFFKANWFRAAQYCRYRGMALASISNETEEEELETLIEGVGFELTALWTSGTDFAEEGKYFWMSNGSPITYTKWFVGEPNGGTTENCLSVNTRGGQGYAWNDAPCTEEHHFICEYYYPTFVEEGYLKTRMFV